MDKHHPPGHQLLTSEQSRPLPTKRAEPVQPLSFKWSRRDKKRYPCGNVWRRGWLMQGDMGCAAHKRLTAPRSTGMAQMVSLQVGHKPLPTVQECATSCRELKGGEAQTSRHRLNLSLGQGEEPKPCPSARQSPEEPPFQAAPSRLRAGGWKEQLPMPTPCR